MNYSFVYQWEKVLVFESPELRRSEFKPSLWHGMWLTSIHKTGRLRVFLYLFILFDCYIAPHGKWAGPEGKSVMLRSPVDITTYLRRESQQPPHKSLSSSVGPHNATTTRITD